MDPRSVLLTHRAVFLRGFYLHMGGGDAPAVSLLAKIPFTMSLQLHCAESAADGDLSYSIFPACLEVLHRAHKGSKNPFYLFPLSRKNALLMWVEGEWVVLLGWLGNTAFM